MTPFDSTETNSNSKMIMTYYQSDKIKQVRYAIHVFGSVYEVIASVTNESFWNPITYHERIHSFLMNVDELDDDSIFNLTRDEMYNIIAEII